MIENLQQECKLLLRQIESKELLRLQENSKKGDKNAGRLLYQRIVSLSESIKNIHKNYIQNKHFQHMSSLSSELSNKNLRDALEKFTILISKLSYSVMNPLQYFSQISQTRLTPIINDLYISLRVIEACQKSPSQTSSLFISDMDYILQSTYIPLLNAWNERINNPEFCEQFFNVTNTLAALNTQLHATKPSFTSNKYSLSLETSSNYIKSLLRKLNELLPKLGIVSPLIQKFAEYQEKSPYKLALGALHIQSFLIHSRGQKSSLDMPALKHLQSWIKINSQFLLLFVLAVPVRFEKIQTPPLVLKIYKDQAIAFSKQLTEIIKLPCTTEKEAMIISLEIYKLFLNELPKIDTNLLEQLFESQESSSPIDALFLHIYLSLESYKNVTLRNFIEIGRHAFLTNEEKLPRPAKPKPQQKKLPKEAPPEEKPLEIQPSSFKLPETITLSNATSLLRLHAAKLPKRLHEQVNEKAIYLNNDLEGSALNLELHLKSLEQLTESSSISCPLAYYEALQRECALALESALRYFMAKHKHLPEEKDLWQHKLDVMALELSLILEEKELQFLQSLSIMLSDSARLDQNIANPRIFALLNFSDPEQAIKQALLDTKLTLQFISQHLDENKLPLITLVNPPILMNNQNLFNHVQSCLQAHQILREKHQFAIGHYEPMPSPWQNALRKQHLWHMIEDIPYHLTLIQPILENQAKEPLPISIIRISLFHLGLLIEKSLKLISFYLALPSNEDPRQHVIFDKIQNRPRRYDHNLIRNLKLLARLELGLSDKERRAIYDLSHFSEFTRYPAKQVGELPRLLTKAAILSEISKGFFTDEQEKMAKKKFGPDQTLWAEKGRAALLKLQREELLPFSRGILFACQKLLTLATEIRT